MKKLFTSILAAMFILAFGAVAYSQEVPKLEFKASGMIDAQFWTSKNSYPSSNSGYTYDVIPSAYKGTGAAVDKTDSQFQSRARLKFDAVMGKNLSGTIYLEMDSTKWGDTPGGNGGVVSERNTFGYWGGDRAAVEVKSVYIDFGLPYFGIPAPMTARIGEQTLSIRPNLFLLTDGPGIMLGIKPDPLTIQPFWFHALEGVTYNADDVDVWGLNANAKISTFTIGGYGLYYNMRTYPFFVSSNTVGATTTLPTSLNSLIQGTMKGDMYWFGAYADGKLAPVDINFDFIYDYGKIERKISSGTPDVKYRGWTSRLKVDYPWEKFNFGVVGAYGTGADTKKSAARGIPDGTSTKNEAFVIPPGAESGGTLGEAIVLYSSWINRGGNGIANSLNYNELVRGPTGGTWFAKVYGSYKVTPQYKLTLQGLYIGDTTDNGNTFGTAKKADGTLRDDSTIGYEFDIINEVEIYKNLKLNLGAGYLFAKDAMDFVRTGTTNFSPYNPWEVVSSLVYTF